MTVVLVGVQAALDPINATPADGKLRLLEGGVVHALLSPHTSRAKANHASTLLLLPVTHPLPPLIFRRARLVVVTCTAATEVNLCYYYWRRNYE
jgi:hypothetical protein